MAALTTSRNTPEWNSSNRFHYGGAGVAGAGVPVEAASSIFIGGMVCLNGNYRAVKAQAIGTAPLDKLMCVGICESVYAGGAVPPGINALNQTGNGGFFPGATATLGTAGAISIIVAVGTFGMDIDSTITTQIGSLCFAADDHTVSLGTLVPNSTAAAMSAAAPFEVQLLPNITPGSFNAYQNTGGTGTHYAEGVDFTVDYNTGLVEAVAGGALANANAAFFVSYYHSTFPIAGRIVSIENGLAYVNFADKAVVL
jgi:hypothetical protein